MRWTTVNGIIPSSRDAIFLRAHHARPSGAEDAALHSVTSPQSISVPTRSHDDRALGWTRGRPVIFSPTRKLCREWATSISSTECLGVNVTRGFVASDQAHCGRRPGMLLKCSSLHRRPPSFWSRILSCCLTAGHEIIKQVLEVRKARKWKLFIAPLAPGLVSWTTNPFLYTVTTQNTSASMESGLRRLHEAACAPGDCAGGVRHTKQSPPLQVARSVPINALRGLTVAIGLCSPTLSRNVRALNRQHDHCDKKPFDPAGAGQDSPWVSVPSPAHWRQSQPTGNP